MAQSKSGCQLFHLTIDRIVSFQQQIDEYRKVVTDRLVSAGIIEDVCK